MKPLRKGSARTGLQDGLLDIARRLTRESPLVLDRPAGANADLAKVLVDNSAVQAAVLGGAIEAAIQEVFGVEGYKQYGPDFWRMATENLWRMTRALDASKLLGKAGQ